MSFSAEWLALRAPFDAEARDAGLSRALAAWAARRRTTSSEPLRIVDLGAGSGNNAQYLKPLLGSAQDWTLVDGDPVLLDVAAVNDPRLRCLKADLTDPIATLVPTETDIVTASALADLVSEDWLTGLIGRVREISAALLIVLTYDGRIVWERAHPGDEELRTLVNRHQRIDKGFGPALGPQAAAFLDNLIGEAGRSAPSDWSIGPSDGRMRHALVHGWADAAIEIDAAATESVQTWRAESEVRACRLSVGHRDHLWLPDPA